MNSQVLHTVWSNISGKAAGEIGHWPLLGVKGLTQVEPSFDLENPAVSKVRHRSMTQIRQHIHVLFSLRSERFASINDECSISFRVFTARELGFALAPIRARLRLKNSSNTRYLSTRNACFAVYYVMSCNSGGAKRYNSSVWTDNPTSLN